MSSVTTTVIGGPFLPPSSRVDKEGDMSSVERDAGFCSGGDDEDLDDLHSPTDVSEDSVEVKVQPICLRNKNKRKCAEPRKVASDDITSRTPYKKRRHFVQDQTPSDLIVPVDRYQESVPLSVEEDVTAITNSRSSVSPFRPWSHHRPASLTSTPSPLPRASPPPPQYTERVPELPNQDEPLSLVLKSDGEDRRRRTPDDARRVERRTPDDARRVERRTPDDARRVERRHPEHKVSIKREHPHDGVLESVRSLTQSNFSSMPIPIPLLMGDTRVPDVRRLELAGVREDFKRLQYGPGVVFKREPDPFERHAYSMTESVGRVHRHMDVATPGPSRVSEASCSFSRDRRTLSDSASDVEDLSGGRGKFSVQSMMASGRCVDDLAGPSSSSCDKKSGSPGGSQRNYKNMTRERRIEANARERTRVHTISAAFDTLRRTIPAYSHNQKLSKLSVLRIACSYILTLSRVAGNDYSADGSSPSLADCVDMVSRTIQTEGKLRKKKDE